MIPWEQLDRAEAPGGVVITLVRHGTDYVIRFDGQELMSSRMHASEDALGARGCDGLKARRGARVLVGGMGLGYTARAALDALGRDARLDIAEIVPAVVRWNRTELSHLAGHPLRDPRVTVLEDDVRDVIAAAHARYDAILLDVDNGPDAFVVGSNEGLYTEAGLRHAARALREGGTYGVWSVADDPRFTSRLRAAGFEVRTEHVRARGARGRFHQLWLARRPSARPVR